MQMNTNQLTSIHADLCQVSSRGWAALLAAPRQGGEAVWWDVSLLEKLRFPGISVTSAGCAGRRGQDGARLACWSPDRVIGGIVVEDKTPSNSLLGKLWELTIYSGNSCT